MFRTLKLAVVAGLAAGAQAGTISEAEVAGLNQNGSIATAEFIPSTAFTVNSNPDVFGVLPTATVFGSGGNGDVDVFRITVAQAGTAYFDIDGAGFDTMLSLFDAAGTLLAYNDDSGSDAGSNSAQNSFLGSMTLAAGDYFIAVSQYGNFAAAAFLTSSDGELTTPGGAAGGFTFTTAQVGNAAFLNGPGVGGQSAYRLEISLEHPTGAAAVVPLPTGAWMGLAGLAGIAALRRRKA